MVDITHVHSGDHHAAPVLTMQDELGITYLINCAQQFWSELEDLLTFPQDDAPTLLLLDSTLRRFIGLCSTYHEQYLQSPLQLEHAISMLLDSELFQFHSERMTEKIVQDAQNSTDPHMRYISYEILYRFGHRRVDVFRSQKRWQPSLPLLMDHILVEIDPDVEGTYVGGTQVGRSNSFSSVPIPIEAKLRSLCVKLLYEVCRVQSLSIQDLKIFDDDFIDYLFDLVEQTKYMQDESFNYCVIKCIIALNEQFMVAVQRGDEVSGQSKRAGENGNGVIRVLMRRLGSTRTFGENMIFMLNRAQPTYEDSCMKFLILKVLFVLFTSKLTAEYFYTNDLRVLVDVFLRELADLDEENESLRHTYLRVLHPLLTRTQLREAPYKRPQILTMLESLINNSKIREVTPTTKRLVERCLSGDWCVQLVEVRRDTGNRPHSPCSDASSTFSPPPSLGSMSIGNAMTMKSIKHSKSVEHLTSARFDIPQPPLRSPLNQMRKPSSLNSSVPSLSALTGQSKGNHSNHKKLSLPQDVISPSHGSISANGVGRVGIHLEVESPPLPTSSSSSVSDSTKIAVAEASALNKPRRRPPPEPPRRRKPPAIPIGKANSGAVITSIRSSEPSPLSKVHKPPVVGIPSS